MRIATCAAFFNAFLDIRIHSVYVLCLENNNPYGAYISKSLQCQISNFIGLCRD